MIQYLMSRIQKQQIQRRPSWKTLRIKEHKAIESSCTDNNNNTSDADNDDDENEIKDTGEYFVIKQEESEFNNVFSFVTHDSRSDSPVMLQYNGSSASTVCSDTKGQQILAPLPPLEQELQDLFDIDKELWRFSQLFNHISIQQE